MPMRRLCLGLALLSIPLAAKADPVCDRIGAAMLAIPDQAGVRQRTVQPGQGAETVLNEAISLPGAMYLRADGAGPWRMVPMDAARRRALAEAAMKELPLSDCAALSPSTQDGVAIERYAYTQPNPLAAGGKSRLEIWLGRADGLPKRLILGDGSYQTMEYGAFAAPSPLVQPRTRSKQP